MSSTLWTITALTLGIPACIVLGIVLAHWWQESTQHHEQLAQDSLVNGQVELITLLKGQVADYEQMRQVQQAYIAQLHQELSVSRSFAEECKAAIRQHGIQQQHQREEEEKKGV